MKDIEQNLGKKVLRAVLGATLLTKILSPDVSLAQQYNPNQILDPSIRVSCLGKDDEVLITPNLYFVNENVLPYSGNLAVVKATGIGNRSYLYYLRTMEKDFFTGRVHPNEIYFQPPQTEEIDATFIPNGQRYMEGYYTTLDLSRGSLLLASALTRNGCYQQEEELWF